MQRISLRAFRGRSSLLASSSPRAATTIGRFNQNQPSVARYAGTSSAPKSAEGASAQSGGARSKDVEEHKASSQDQSLDTEQPQVGAMPDGLAERVAAGRTGGGEPLGEDTTGSSSNAPAQPRIVNTAVPGEGRSALSDEQKSEVDQHNKEFDQKHDKAAPAAEDKVDKNFWSGAGNRGAG